MLLLLPTLYVHVEFPVQLRLALAPAVTVQLEPLVQLRLGLLPAVTEQVLPLVQAPLQEALQLALPQLPPLVHWRLQPFWLASQLVFWPVQDGPPQAATRAPTPANRYLAIMQ